MANGKSHHEETMELLEELFHLQTEPLIRALDETIRALDRINKEVSNETVQVD